MSCTRTSVLSALLSAPIAATLIFTGLVGEPAEAQPEKQKPAKAKAEKQKPTKQKPAKAKAEKQKPTKQKPAKAKAEKQKPEKTKTEKAESKKEEEPASKPKRKLTPLQQAKLLLNAPERDKVRQGLEQLKMMKSRAIVAPISARLRDGLPPTLVDLAVEALVASGKPQAAPILIELYGHRRAGVRKTAVSALGTLRARSAKPLLRKALDDGDPAVRTAAAEALGRIGDRAALKELYPLFERGETQVLESIAALATPKELNRLVGYLNEHPLGTLKPAFVKLLERKNFPARGKLALIARLGEAATPDTEEFLRDRLNKLPDKGRKTFMVAIGKALKKSQKARMMAIEKEQSKAQKEKEKAEPKEKSKAKAQSKMKTKAEPKEKEKTKPKAEAGKSKPSPATKSGAASKENR